MASEDITVPSMLDQYTSLYNKNGRIGIYTKKERSEIIERFREKRRRRVWKKKIRYHCRKNLADKRVRIKGRFVKKIEDVAEAENENDSSVEEGVDEMDESPTIDTSDTQPNSENDCNEELLFRLPPSGRTTRLPPSGRTTGVASASNGAHRKNVMQSELNGNGVSGVQPLKGDNNGNAHEEEEHYERMRRHSIAY